MTTVLMQYPFAPEEIRELEEEFPSYSFVLAGTGVAWEEVEILYGDRLTSEELARAHRLRWIHAPSSNMEGLCVQEIEETTNLLVTNTKDPDVHQMAEFAIGTMLAFGKNLYTWHNLQKKTARTGGKSRTQHHVVV